MYSFFGLGSFGFRGNGIKKFERFVFSFLEFSFFLAVWNGFFDLKKGGGLFCYRCGFFF